MENIFSVFCIFDSNDKLVAIYHDLEGAEVYQRIDTFVKIKKFDVL